jgi:hypothetical protein
MAKHMVTDQLDHTNTNHNTSTNYVFYQAVRDHGRRLKTVSLTKIGKRHIYKFFIDYNNNYYLLRCILHLGSTSFVISPNATKAFKIPVSITKRVQYKDLTGREIVMDGLYMIPLRLFFGNRHSCDPEYQAFEVMKTSDDYDCLMPAWYLEKHKARGTTTCHLHFPHCGFQ